MTSLFQKLIAGGPERKTRLHDEMGNLVSLRNLILHGPLAGMTWVGKVCFGYRPAVPWMSFSAIRLIRQFLDKDKTVLEFGSGMSTIWFAKQSRFVYSVEDFEPWYLKVKSLITVRHITNIDYSFLQGNQYSSYMLHSGQKLNLIIIDGNQRGRCAETAVQLIADGGMIYLDNSDKHSLGQGGDTRDAEKTLLEFAFTKGAAIRYFVDFSPCDIFVQQGMLVILQGCSLAHT